MILVAPQVRLPGEGRSPAKRVVSKADNVRERRYRWAPAFAGEAR